MAVVAATAVIALTLGWVLGRAVGGDGVDTAALAPTTTATMTSAANTAPDTTAVDAPSIVGDELPGANFDDPDDPGLDDPGPVSVPRNSTSDGDELTTGRIAIDERVAGLPIRLVGVSVLGRLAEVDLANGTVIDYPVERLSNDGRPLVVGDDWVLATSYGRIMVVRSDGTASRLDLGDSFDRNSWLEIHHVPGTDLFWAEVSGLPRDGGRHRLVDIDGASAGPELEVPVTAWVQAVDPRSGGLVVNNMARNYVITPDGVDYLGVGTIVGINRELIVTHDCDEHLVCSLYLTDRDTGGTRPLFDDPELNRYQWYPFSGPVGAMSPDGRWVAVFGATGMLPPTAGIVEVDTGRYVEVLSTVEAPPSVVWSADGRFAFFADRTIPTAYDTATGERFSLFTETVRWNQLGVRPSPQAGSGTGAGTLLSVAREEPIEG